ncbi:hypothetical protein Bca101_072640 [Brassica carinata]
MGLPPALSVTPLLKLENWKSWFVFASLLMNISFLPYVSNVQTEPVVVQIDKLDLVLEENPDADVTKGPSSAQSPTASGKSNGYGFADNMSYIFHYVDQIADGMTLQVKVVNLLLETGGGAHREGGAAWAAHLASITICNLVLYTTNESWKLYQIDLPPHRDMFTDANLARSEEENLRDDNGANRVFFGGERFLDGISGQAHNEEPKNSLDSIHGNSVTNGLRSNLQLNNSLVNLYARHGDVKHARKLFDRMPNRDLGSWTAMISGYSRRENHRSALLLFKEMRREPVRANDFTYGSVLMSMSCKDLGCLKEGMQIHGCVEKGRFAGNLVVRSVLLYLYPKFSKMEDARLLFDSMKERDLVS